MARPAATPAPPWRSGPRPDRRRSPGRPGAPADATAARTLHSWRPSPSSLGGRRLLNKGKDDDGTHSRRRNHPDEAGRLARL
ncbi:hypothetical protein EJC49_06080 [Aquibium carbonis]|uniref:Uncharacterized protein n=1 Tax=Aquibium carbonis TaxID=2495581 RepID=A0A429Z0Y3_9HYPH|nr:hypothetical protein EJC49_06080 [Aquibium carbonis]